MNKSEPPIDYMARTRAYYAALGFEKPYAWAHHTETPFLVPHFKLAQATVAIVTTGALYRAGLGDQGPGAMYNGAAKFYEVYSEDCARPDIDIRISHIAYDRVHTSAADQNTYFPLAALERSRARGRIGAVAPRFYGLPTDRSQRATVQRDAPRLLALCREDGVDAVIFVPNCPVCHQSVSLAARHLEANGIATLVLGCARDIVEYCGVPRFYFSDFPLGNAAGKPNNPASQDAVVAAAVELFEKTDGPLATMLNPERWSASDHWKNDYCNIDALSDAELRALREQFDTQKERAKMIRIKDLHQ